MPAYTPPKDDKEKKKREGAIFDFARNVIEDVRELGPGMIVGPIMLGRDLVMDTASVLKGDVDFDRTGKTVGGMARGFYDESPLVPLVRGDFGDTWHRWFDRPVSGSLDIGGGASILRNISGRTARTIAPLAPASERQSLMKHAGFQRIGKSKDIDVTDIKPTTKYKFAKNGIRVGDEIYAKPTHRRILPSKNDPMLLVDPRRPDYYKLDDPAVAKKLQEVDAWKRMSSSILPRQVGEGLAGLRRNRSYEKVGSASWQQRRKQKRAGEKTLYTPFSTAKAYHDVPNKQLLNSVAKELRARGQHKVDIEAAVDMAAYLSAAGYSNLSHRIHDIKATHEGENPLHRKKRLKEKGDRLQEEGNVIRAQLETMDRQSPEGKELRDRLHQLNRDEARARKGVIDTDKYWKLRHNPESRNPAHDPLSGYKHEKSEIKRIGPNIIDSIMRSDAMEKWLDDMELAAQDMELYSMNNYGPALSKQEAINNRFRMAELYQPEGITERTKTLYSRQRKDGRGVRNPLFIPMRHSKIDNKEFEAGKIGGPTRILDEGPIADPMNLELWGHNVRKPISRALFFKKHAEELRDYYQHKIVGNMRKMGIPMSKNQVQQWQQMGVHDDIPTVSTVRKDGVPNNPSAPFIDIGEFGSVIDQHMSDLDEITDGLRAQGYTEEANGIARIRAEYSAKQKDKEGLYRSDRSLSAKQMQRKKELEDGMTIVVPSEVYNSMVGEMIKTAHILMEISNAPSARKVAKSTLASGMKWWRYSILHTRPKWMFNNAIGSVYLLAMQEGWGKAFMSILKGSTIFNWARDLLGIKKTDFERGGSRYLNEVVEKKMSDVLYAQGSTSMFGFSDRQLSKLGKTEKLFQKSAAINSKFADNPARGARVNQLLDNLVDRKIDQMQYNGQSITKSRDAMKLELLNNLETRQKIAEVALEDMIDFQDLTNAERFIVANLMPFYSWIKGSTKATAGHIVDKPGRVMWQKEAGAEAHRQIEDQFPGGIPSYLWGSLPRGLKGDEWGNLINFAGASPAQTLADLTAMGGFAAGAVPMQFGQESPLAMSSPLITTFSALTSYRHPFFGTPIARDELAPNIVWDILQPPQYKALYQSGKTPLGKRPWEFDKPYDTEVERIAKHQPWTYATRLFAPYTQQINPTVAAERFREEQSDLGRA